MEQRTDKLGKGLVLGAVIMGVCLVALTAFFLRSWFMKQQALAAYDASELLFSPGDTAPREVMTPDGLRLTISVSPDYVFITYPDEKKSLYLGDRKGSGFLGGVQEVRVSGQQGYLFIKRRDLSLAPWHWDGYQTLLVIYDLNNRQVLREVQNVPPPVQPYYKFGTPTSTPLPTPTSTFTPTYDLIEMLATSTPQP